MDEDGARSSLGNLSQTDSETESVWSVGDSCRVKWSGDDKYYTGVVKKLCRQQGCVSALVKFTDYESDECEEVDIRELLKLPKLTGKPKQHHKDSEADALKNTEVGSVGGFFKPLTGSEESARLEEKYGHESDSDSDDKKSSQSSWISPSYQTTGKVSQWKIGSPAKSQTPSSQRRKVPLAFGGFPKKGGRVSKTTSPRSKPKSTTESPQNTTSRKSDNSVTNDAKRENASVNVNTTTSHRENGTDGQEKCRPNQGRTDDLAVIAATDNEQFGGFDEDDMEKPKFSFVAPGTKVPYVLDEEKKVQVPATLNQYLRDYQREGIQFLYSHYVHGRGAILGDDMGLGKTVQVIGLLAALLGKEGNRMDVMRQKPKFIRLMSDIPGLQDSKKCLPFLIIGPGSVLYNWLEELETWGHFTARKYHGADKAACLNDVRRGKVEVVVTTFETFRDNVESLNAIDWEAIFVDEVHRIKGMKAQTTQALRSTPCLCRYGLTGTALQNNVLELWCILDWAQPDVLGSQEEFEEQFVRPIQQGQKHDATKRELAEARRKKEVFARVRNQMMIRRTKKLIADQLPQKTDRVVFCRLSPLQVSVYKAVLSHPDMHNVLNMHNPCPCNSGAQRGKCCYKKTRSGKKLWSIMFTFMHLLLKTANHVALLIPNARTSPEQLKQAKEMCDIAFKDHPEFVSLTREAAFRTLSDPKYCGKMKVLQGVLSVFAKSHSKVLVFSYSTRLLDILEQHVISEGYMYRRIDGKVMGKRRQEIVREFNTDPDIFLCLISTKAGGLGLNMTGANKVVIFDPNWNPSHDLQAQDRAYRIGQRRDVEVYRLISAGTIEENIYLRQIYKQQLDNVVVGTENARRYFHGIQGDSDNKGELFGIKNMFQLRTGDSCLTMDILHRNAKVEAGIAGYDMANYIPSRREVEAAENDESFDDGANDSRDSRGDESSDEESFFGLQGLFDTTASDAEDDTPSTSKELPEDPLPSSARKRSKNKRCTDTMDTFSDGTPSLQGKRRAAKRSPQKADSGEPSTSKQQRRGEDSGRDLTQKKMPGSSDKKARERRHGGGGRVSFSDSRANEDSLKTPSFSSVSSVFDECGVIHVHDNPAVVGGSRAEDHMSRCAMQDVFELQTNTQALALFCDPLSQSSSEDEEAGAASGKSPKKKRSKRRAPAKDHNSARAVDHGRWRILLGQTPAAIKRKQWKQLKDAQNCTDDIELAQRIVSASLEDRLAMLRDLYKGRHDSELHEVLDGLLSVLAASPLKEVKGSGPDGEKHRGRGGGGAKDGAKAGRGRGRKGQKKGRGTKQSLRRRTPVKQKQPARGLVYSETEDTELSQSLEQGHQRRLPNVDSESDTSSDIDIGAKISPSKHRGTPKKRSPVNKTRQAATQVPAKSANVGSSHRKRPASRTPSATRILDDIFDSVDGDVCIRKGEDVEGLLQELGAKQTKPTYQKRGVKSSTEAAGLFESKTSTTGVLQSKTEAEENQERRRIEKGEFSLLDDIFSDCAVGTTKRKPPPKSKQKVGASYRKANVSPHFALPGTSSSDSTTAQKGSDERAPTDSAKNVRSPDIISTDSSKTVSSPDIFSELLNNSTLQDDSLDCFGDSSLWKKRKKVNRIPPKKVDRLLQETKDDYADLFERGRLVPRKKGKVSSPVQKYAEGSQEMKSVVDPSGSLFS